MGLPLFSLIGKINDQVGKNQSELAQKPAFLGKDAVTVGPVIQQKQGLAFPKPAPLPERASSITENTRNLSVDLYFRSASMGPLISSGRNTLPLETVSRGAGWKAKAEETSGFLAEGCFLPRRAAMTNPARRIARAAINEGNRFERMNYDNENNLAQ